NRGNGDEVGGMRWVAVDYGSGRWRGGGVMGLVADGGDDGFSGDGVTAVVVVW
nr:hypothetical protein [Tanacetum cinerariifolium]